MPLRRLLPPRFADRTAPCRAGRPRPLRAWPRAAALAAALVLAGCASTPRPPAPTAPAAASGASANDARTALAEGLAIEKRWLDSWFRGTPVLIAQRADGALVVEVPREFCFDPGRSHIKPALAAVLDKLAESLRRRPAARLALLAAPADRAADAPLALQRATQLRQHLRERGVVPARLAEPSATGAAAVQLRIGGGPA